jgi:hypothetical protein
MTDYNEAAKLVRTEDLLNLLLLRIPLKECADRLHISYQTVRKYVSEPEFLDSLRNLSQSVYADVIETLKCEKKSMAQRMLEASDRALERLENLVQSQTESVALRACDSILDRTSETARNQKIDNNLSGRFTIDPVMLQHAALTAQELNTPKILEPDASKEKDE